MRLLVTNDDGIEAPGILALVQALDAWVAAGTEADPRSAVVVAPSQNFSGAGAAVGDVTHMDDLAYARHHLEGVSHINCFGLEAAPALCTIVGTLGGFGPRPDVVVSGINAGVNVGRSVLHSGTVGATLTASQLGLKGLAISMQYIGADTPYATAAELAVDLLEIFPDAPERTVLNLNVPALARHALAGVRHGRSSTAGIIKSAAWGDAPTEPTEDRGTIPLRLGSAVPELGDTSDEEADDDGALVAAGFASITPLRSVREATDEGVDELVRTALGVLRRN